MNKKTIAALFISVAVVAVAGGYFFSQQETGEAIQHSRPISADALFKASFADMEGKPQALEQWQAKYKTNGLVFVGIAIDQKDKVIAFADEIGVNYPVLLGELGAVELTRNLGNRLGGLPYTVIVDRSGHIVATEMGELSKARLEPVIKSLL
jgi:uncharacterized protein YneF (UPF0154 family)